MHIRPLQLTMAALIVTLITAGNSSSLDFFGKGQAAFQPLKDAGGRFSLEYPIKDWQRLSGGGTVLFTLAQKSGLATVAVEHTPLRLALEPDEITELFAQLEIETLTRGTPTPSDVHARILDHAGHKVVVIDFQRDGIKGPERVRHYVFPIGANVYRLICTASAPQFLKYEPVFVRIAESFKPML